MGRRQQRSSGFAIPPYPRVKPGAYGPVSGVVFSRTGVANYWNGGVLQQAATGVKRDSHYINGFKTLFIEVLTRTNVVIHKRDFTNAAWVSGGGGVTPLRDQVGIDGSANTASSLLANGADATILQAITDANKARFQTCWIRRLIGTGEVDMTMDNGATWTALTFTGTYSRVSIPTQTLANPTVGFRIRTGGDKIVVDWMQNENGTEATSEIGTLTDNAASETRNFEVFKYNIPSFASPPAAFSFLLDCIPTTHGSGIFSIGGGAGGANPQAYCEYSGSNAPRFRHQNGVSNRIATSPAPVPVMGNRMRLLSRLYADGHVDITIVRGDGSVGVGVDAGTLAFAGAWTAGTMQIGSFDENGTDGCGLALIGAVIAPGIQSLSRMLQT